MSSVSTESPQPVLLTGSEAARVFRVSERTVRRWAAAGTLTPIDVGGVRRYLVREVAALIGEERCAA